MTGTIISERLLVMCQGSGDKGGPVPSIADSLNLARSEQEESQNTLDERGQVGILFNPKFSQSPTSYQVGAILKPNATTLRIEMVKKWKNIVKV